MSKPRASASSDKDVPGCLTILLWVFVIWALLFGVTIDGKHRQIGCSCDKGVEVQP